MFFAYFSLWDSLHIASHEPEELAVHSAPGLRGVVCRVTAP